MGDLSSSETKAGRIVGRDRNQGGGSLMHTGWGVGAGYRLTEGGTQNVSQAAEQFPLTLGP